MVLTDWTMAMPKGGSGGLRSTLTSTWGNIRSNIAWRLRTRRQCAFNDKPAQKYSHQKIEETQFIPFRFVSSRFVSFRFVSFRFVSFRLVSFGLVSFRFVSFFFV